MPDLMSKEEFDTPAGRKAAWRSLFLDDHGFLRKIYENSHKVGDEMWRTYQPSPQDIEKWAQKGIKTVINLRGRITNRGGKQPGYYWLEEEACEKHGIRFESFRAYSREAPRKGFCEGLDALFRDIPYPAIMHCKSGADRAGIGSVLYLFLKEERPLDEAMAHLSFTYGHVKSGKTGVLDHFFTHYRAAAAADGVEPNREHFLAWVASPAYDPQAVREDFKAGTFGSLLTEKILRRE